MESADGFTAGKIGDGATDAEDPRVAARGQVHRFGRLCEQSTTGVVRRGHDIEQRAIGLCIRTNRVVAIAFRLERASGGDADGDLDRPLGWWWENQISGADRLDVDVKVDPVEQRA